MKLDKRIVRFLSLGSVLVLLAACGSGGGGSGGNGSTVAPATSMTSSSCPAFGANGIGFVTTDMGSVFFSNLDKAYALVIQPGLTDCDSKIVVAGTSGGSGSVLVRYNYDGSLDTSFGPSGSNGIVTIFFNNDLTSIYSMTLDSLGRIVVAGSFFNATNGTSDFLIARYDSNGILDTGFGGGAGMVTTNFGGREDYVNAVAIDSVGRIVAAGTSCAAGSLSCTKKASVGSDDSDLVLARYLDNGDLDTGFNTDGKVRTNFTGESGGSLALVIQPGDKPLVAGFLGTASGTSSTVDFVLVRYDDTGILDGTFGAKFNGIERTDINGRTDTARAIALDSLGRIVVAGTTYNDSVSGGTFNDFALARYDGNGNLDTTNFGNGTGKATLDFFFSSQDDAAALVILPGDEIEVVGGTDLGGASNYFALARFDASGGFVSLSETDFLTGSSDGYALAIQPDGKIVAAGYAVTATGQDFALVRVDP